MIFMICYRAFMACEYLQSIYCLNQSIYCLNQSIYCLKNILEHLLLVTWAREVSCVAQDLKGQPVIKLDKRVGLGATRILTM